jgi:hypothetical protein
MLGMRLRLLRVPHLPSAPWQLTPCIMDVPRM